MDPHSRLSQFNQRPPKAGPAALPSRQMMDTPHPKSPSLDGFARRPTATRSRKASASSGTLPDAQRPIATNERIKQDERFRKDMYLAFVNNALQQKTVGNTDPYDALIDQFNIKKMATDGPSPIPQLRLWLHALMHVVSRLDRTHATLIEAIVRMPWMTMDSSLVKTYTSFIEILVSARPEYLSLVLGRIAHGFTYQSGLQALEAGLPESSSAPLTRRTVYDRIHHLLRHLLALVPTLSSTLQPLLAQNFPHKRQSQAAQVTYIRNILRVSEYCPEIADKLLSTIIDRAIQIDVEIQVEIEELEASGAAQEQAELFELDPFDVVVGQEAESDPEDDDGSEGDAFSDLSSDAGGQDDDDAPPVEAPVDVDRITEMVNKLDAVLKLLFDHLDHPPRLTTTPALPSEPPTPGVITPPMSFPASSRTSSPTQSAPDLEPEDAHAHQLAQFHTLLAIFTRTILRTFKSRYTQFILFWFASRDGAFADLFLGELVARALLEPAAPAVARAAAASYVASFVSRAAFVGRAEARGAVAVLCRFLAHEVDLVEASGGAGASDAAPPAVFYAVAQAVFLIFCFRWRDLMDGEDEDTDADADAGPRPRKWMAELGAVQRAVACAHAPLRACSENVARQFARVAHATGFLYVFPLLGAPRAGTLAVGQGELTSFFPFDPYKLPRSVAYIEPIYREWASVAIDDGEDSDSEEDEEGGEEDVESDGVSPRWVGEGDVAADGLGASFGGMSISPAPAPVSVLAV